MFRHATQVLTNPGHILIPGIFVMNFTEAYVEGVAQGVTEGVTKAVKSGKSKMQPAE